MPIFYSEYYAKTQTESMLRLSSSHLENASDIKTLMYKPTDKKATLGFVKY